jgi:hypothetical protein
MCDLCVLLGIKNPTHKREFCFCDPKSKSFRPDYLKKRIADA